MAATPLPIRPRAALEIGLARVHGALPADRDRLRLQLDAVRPSAVGVPERAILFVPRLVAGKRLARRGDGSGFATAVTEALRAALRNARRPGEARSADDAVLFIDELEGAACVIAQWLAGARPAERAWWPLFTGGMEPPTWWRRHILPDARRLPAVVAKLARRGLGQAWIARLEPDDVRTAVAAVAAGHGLPLEALSRSPRRRPVDEEPGEPATDWPAALTLVDAVAPEARLADLPPPARLLFLMTLIAERRPAMLTTRAARDAFAAASSGNLRLPPQSDPPQRRKSPGAIQTRRPLPAGTEPSGALRRPDARPVARSVGNIVERPSTPVEHSTPAKAVVRVADEPFVTPWTDIEPAPVPAEIATGFGGLLFVLNALLALGIYGDSSRPERSVPGLSPFGLLRLLGRSWFGREFAGDPLHRLLVGLAGGRGADAARDFEAPLWSVPQAWLSPWPEAGPPRIRRRRRAPMLWHPAGFPLSQLDPAATMTRARWIGCLRLYLEARLACALGSGGGAEAVAMLCRRPARIAADGEEVVVRFALDDHPLAIRLAGLDRDPGWIPAARRSVRYLFR